MSMLDSFFSKGFKAAKCKTLLKLTIPRIKLLRNRREIQIKQMRKDIAKLLETGQEATARIRVEHIIREENMMAAQEILELFCELISVRLPIIEIQRECPLDLKEAISSVCFAAPRCADLQELLQVQMLFATKYGKEFVAAATELRPDCGVNRQIIELLSVRAPAPETKLKLLKEIAEEHQLDWDPSASETEFLKQPEDLLNGPAQFMSGSQLPLSKEKHEEPPSSVHNQDPCDQSDSDSCFDGLDFPEVPKVSLRPSGNQTSPPPVTHPETETVHPEADDESFKHAGVSSNLQHEPDLEYKEMDKERIVGQDEIKQFLPFIAPPSVVSSGFPATAADLSSYQQTSEHEDIREEDVLSAAQAAADSAECCPHLAASATPANLSASQLWTTSEERLDLQDVLAAAQVAADSAERAATAARSAASLAQLRINELVKRKNENVHESTQVNPFHQELADEADGMEKQHLNHEDLKAHISPHTQDAVDPENHYMPESSIPATETANVRYDSFTNDHSHHQPQRLPSMDDDPYFSYPNLFTPQGSERGPESHSFTGKSSG